MIIYELKVNSWTNIRQNVLFKHYVLMFTCMGLLCTRMSVHHVSACIPQRPQEGIGSPGTGITEGCKMPCGCSESNLGLLEKQPVFLTAWPSLQPQK